MADQNETRNLITEIKGRLYSNKWAVIIIVIIFVLSNTREIYEDAEFYYLKFFAGGKLPKEVLRGKSFELSTKLLDFVEERKYYEPEFNMDNFEESVEKIVQYSEETLTIYLRIYYPEVSEIRIDYLKHGISNYDIDTHYRHPTGHMAIQEMALALIDMKNEL